MPTARVYIISRLIDHPPQLARIYSSALGGPRFEEARNALFALRKKGPVGTKLWRELWTASYQLLTRRAGKSFSFDKLNLLLLYDTHLRVCLPSHHLVISFV